MASAARATSSCRRPSLRSKQASAKGPVGSPTGPFRWLRANPANGTWLKFVWPVLILLAILTVGVLVVSTFALG
jgi:hypothetical protein